MRKYLLTAGFKRKLSGRIKSVRDALTMLTVFYVVAAALTYPEPLLHRSMGFGLFYALIFLSYTMPGLDHQRERVPLYDLLLAALALVVTGYLWLNVDRLLYRFVFFDPVLPMDMIFACLAILLMLEGTRRVLGPWLPLLTMMAFLYLFGGQYIPGRFAHQGFSFSYIVDGLFMTSYGLWGSTLGIAIGQVMIFLIFGAFILKSGAGDFLYDFASSIAGKSAGGMAKVAVISSAMFGMITGGPLSNVSTTGSLTIPAMMKKGYPPEFAASAESCASIGGTFIPPVMGSVIFIMSEVIGIPYGSIARQAVLPAVIYYLALLFVIDAQSKKMGLAGDEANDREPLLRLVLRGIPFFVPIGFLIFRISLGVTPVRAGIETVLVIFLVNFFGSRSLFSFSGVFKALQIAVNRGMMIVSTLAACGVMIGIINITGITTKFTSYLMSMVDFSILLSLVMVMLMTIFMGLAMSTSTAYIITSVICSPVLILAGLEPLSVHLFILYFAATSSITPPVAMTSFVAASIAGVAPMKVGIRSMRMGIAAYLLPFSFVYNPSILLIGRPSQIVFSGVMAILGVALVAYGVEGWWMNQRVSRFVSIALAFSGIMVLSGRVMYVAASIGILLAITVLHRNQKKVNVQAEHS
ncbi:MAG: TRAP transporter fused permease subunit [Bacillota bacterium]|nr:TRAP transporter fused permease subunit [Bacillota bacterium]MDW7676590.1 TRAP transporter fused permease subunit [Bacillota bacterium]